MPSAIIPNMYLNDDNNLIINMHGFYIREKNNPNASAYKYIINDVNQYILSNNDCLLYDKETKSLKVLSSYNYFDNKYITLIWLQNLVIKGLWAFIYYDNFYFQNIQQNYLNPLKQDLLCNDSNNFYLNFSVGDINDDGNKVNTNFRYHYKMTVPIINNDRYLITDWTKYRIFVRKILTDGSITKIGWMNSNTLLESGYVYWFVIGRVIYLDDNGQYIESREDFTNEEIEEINQTYLQQKDNEIDYNDKILSMIEIVPITAGIIATFSNNIYNIKSSSYFYIRNLNSRIGYTTIRDDTLGTTGYNLSHNDALFYNINNNKLTVLSVAITADPIPNNYILLLWNQSGYLKGQWAVYAYKYILETRINTNIKYNQSDYLYRLMNRQGEGYGYPDNSFEAITAAIKDGYRNIRIAVSYTNDGIFYCTHCYELRNNKTLNLNRVKYAENGELYDGDILINNVSSEFIDTLLYSNYSIPKLEDVLDAIMVYNSRITFELKDGFNNIDICRSLIDLAKYYGIENVTYSGNQSQLDIFTSINQNLNVAIIFNYNDQFAQNFINRYKNKCKSLRFDCYWVDTISKNSLINVIRENNCIIKLGGTNPPKETVLDAVRWCDVCETNLKFSTIDF